MSVQGRQRQLATGESCRWTVATMNKARVTGFNGRSPRLIDKPPMPPASLSRLGRRTAIISADTASRSVSGSCLIGTGTQSGPTDGEKGCLMELSFNGRESISLSNGETCTMLEDGDTVILRAWGERVGFVRIGLGDCRGTVLPARAG